MQNPKNDSEEGEYIEPAQAVGHGSAKNMATTFWKTALLREKAVIVFGIMYALSPIDLIPEVILGPLGLLDDGGAIFVVFLTILGVLRRQRSSRGRTVLPSK